MKTLSAWPSPPPCTLAAPKPRARIERPGLRRRRPDRRSSPTCARNQFDRIVSTIASGVWSGCATHHRARQELGLYPAFDMAGTIGDQRSAGLRRLSKCHQRSPPPDAEDADDEKGRPAGRRPSQFSSAETPRSALGTGRTDEALRFTVLLALDERGCRGSGKP